MARPMVTPRSSSSPAAAPAAACCSRPTTMKTVSIDAKSATALMSSSVFVPTLFTISAVSPDPAIPPSMTPPPTNPNRRLAWRGS